MKKNSKLLTKRKTSTIVYQSKTKSKLASSVKNTSKQYSAIVSKGISSSDYSRKFPDDYINKIVCGDSLSIMREMPSNSIDVVVTSPPYNLKNSTGNGMKDGRGGKWAGAALVNGYSNYDDNMPHDKYSQWQAECLKEMYRLIKDDGVIFYNHKWRVQAGLLQDRKDIIGDLPVRQIIIWKRKGGINFNLGYFLPTYEVIYMIPKPKFKLAPKANAYGDVWEFTQEMNNPHPAPFPVRLIERILSSVAGKLVLDPFMGSGTTAVVALGLHKQFIGIELSPDYCKLAEERVNRNRLHSELKHFGTPLLFEEVL